MRLTRQTLSASMLFRLKCLISNVFGTLLFNLQQHFTLQANARWAVAEVNTTLETRGLVTNCCDGAQRGVHGFAQGQRQWNALVGADAHPFGFLMWPCKNNTADILQDCYAGCELTPLVCLGWPWLVLMCSKTSGGQPSWNMRMAEVLTMHLLQLHWILSTNQCSRWQIVCFYFSTITYRFHNDWNKPKWTLIKKKMK